MTTIAKNSCGQVGRRRLRRPPRHSEAGDVVAERSFAKPGEVRRGGIALFWRLDLDPGLVLHAFALENGRYVEVATVHDLGEVPVPWGSMRIDLRGIPEW